MESPKPKVHFYFVDALRGIAALWVVLFHASHAISKERFEMLTSILPPGFGTILSWGRLGVPIFFVISGFVIAHSLHNAKIDLSYFKYFTLRRLVRLTPPYYFSIFITLVFAAISSYVKGEVFAPGDRTFSILSFASHLFYLQSFFGFGHFNDVYWTLCLEIQFYLCFCGLLVLAHWLHSSYNLNYSRAIVFVPVALIAAIFSIVLTQGNSAISNTFLAFFHEFLLGVFAYWVWKDKLKSFYFYLYCALLTPGIFNSPNYLPLCLITAIVLLEAGKKNYLEVWLKWRFFQFLGKISYSLYLIHIPLYGAIYFILSSRMKVNAFNELFFLLFGTSACILFSTLMWQFVEKPSINMTKKINLIKNDLSNNHKKHA